MKLVVFGGRDFNNPTANNILMAIFKDNPNMIIIEGGANGADKLGKTFANNNGIQCQSYKANWEDLVTEPVKIKTRPDGSKYNVLAGHNRNSTMANTASHAIGFWDTKSSGTFDMIKKCIKSNSVKSIVIFDYNLNIIYTNDSTDIKTELKKIENLKR